MTERFEAQKMAEYEMNLKLDRMTQRALGDGRQKPPKKPLSVVDIEVIKEYQKQFNEPVREYETEIDEETGEERIVLNDDGTPKFKVIAKKFRVVPPPDLDVVEENELADLPSAQIKKLLSGGRVRVKSGIDHQVQLVQEHAKKLASASKKGAGIMLQLDPYARQYNSHLEGCGVGKQIKNVYRKAGQFVKGHKEVFRPLATHLKQQAHQNIADATMSALDDYNLDPSLVNAYAQLAHQSVPQGGSLKSFNKGLTKFVRSPAVKVVRRALKPIGSQIMRDANILAEQALQTGMDQAMGQLTSVPQGGSLKSFNKGLTKFVRSPAVKVVRRALKPIGSQIMRDANILAEQALQTGMDQAMGSLTAPSGMGIRGRPRGRPSSGGALFPAGMGYF